MKTAFIIRFHYEKEDPRFEWRFEYFKDEVLPRILAQKGEFDIAIRCNPAHDQIFRKLSPKIKTFKVKNEGARYKTLHGKKYFFDFVSFGDCINLDRYELQIGLDSDDLIGPKYLESILKALREFSEKEATHICFQPGLKDVGTGKIYKMPQRYNQKKGSAFFALYQPAEIDPYVFAYEESHLTIGRHFKNKVVMPEGMCFASCHHINESTHL